MVNVLGVCIANKSDRIVEDLSEVFFSSSLLMSYLDCFRSNLFVICFQRMQCNLHEKLCELRAMRNYHPDISLC